MADKSARISLSRAVQRLVDERLIEFGEEAMGLILAGIDATKPFADRTPKLEIGAEAKSELDKLSPEEWSRKYPEDDRKFVEWFERTNGGQPILFLRTGKLHITDDGAKWVAAHGGTVTAKDRHARLADRANIRRAWRKVLVAKQA